MLGRMGVHFWREADVASKDATPGPASKVAPRVHHSRGATGSPRARTRCQTGESYASAPRSPTSPVGILAGE